MILTAMHLSKPLLEELRSLALIEDRSMASIVRQSITEFLNRKAIEPARRPTRRRK